MKAFLHELVLSVPMDQVELVSDMLMELNALSVSVEDADAGSDNERPIFGEPNMPIPTAESAWQSSTLKAIFKEEEEPVEAATIIMAQEWSTDIHLESIYTIAEQDWVSLTQSQFDPVEIKPDFWIVPSWHEAPEAAKQIIQLDPGMAFGTGTHATTHMCLQWIAEHADQVKEQRVLDYGCGSGILAIAAARYGASAIDAVDIDKAAVDSAGYNAENNLVKINIGFPELAQGQYNVVLANILATPLKLLAPLLCDHVAAGGHLILAGILEWQAEELIQAYAPWVKLSVNRTLDGWILMTATK